MKERHTVEPLHGFVLRDYDQAVSILAEARRQQGIRVVDLAAELDCKHPQVVRWLTGEREMLGCSFLDLAHALNHDVALIPRGTRLT